MLFCGSDNAAITLSRCDSLLGPSRDGGAPSARNREHLVAQFAIEICWQESVIVALRPSLDRTEVYAGPNEAIEVARDDPRTLSIKAKAGFGLCKYLDCLVGSIRRRVGDRRYSDNCSPLDGLYRKNDDTGAIFAAFLKPARRLVAPKIGVTDDKAGRWIGKRHALLGFVIELACRRCRL